MRANTYNGSGSNPVTISIEENSGQDGLRSLDSHYQVPNLTSMLYEFTNNESERVKKAFRIGNFVSLRDLPAHLMPGNVS